MKVLIADDEVKVCRLIEFFVDWESLGMEIVAIVNNGADALEEIKRQKPDIAITDIRMPGYSGLEMIERAKVLSPGIEFIIISGYRHFDYAQQAIRFGVKDYLLKPINQEELVRTLIRMRDEYLHRTEQLSNEEKLRIFERDDIERVRTELFNELIFDIKRPKEELTLQYLNENLHFHFQEGLFQLVIIKVDGLHGNVGQNKEYIKKKIIHLIMSNLKKLCFDLEYLFEDDRCFLVLNYDRNQKHIRAGLKSQISELTLQKDIFKELEVTIGAGATVDSPSEIKKSYKTAVWAVSQRLVEGTNRIIEGMQMTVSSFVETNVFYDFNKMLNDAIEYQDADGIVKSISFLEKQLETKEEVTGHEILLMSKEAMNVYLFGIKNNQLPLDSVGSLFHTFNKEVDTYSSVKEVFTYLSNTMCTSFIKIIEEKRQADTKPIRDAKRYISEHFEKPITLELVSDIVGFNSSYFSLLFKKESGYTFTEYLQKKRMDKAKELLKLSSLSVAAICEAVGYSDVKYFTKSFTKYTNLKPNEYRKLYS